MLREQMLLPADQNREGYRVVLATQRFLTAPLLSRYRLCAAPFGRPAEPQSSFAGHLTRR